MTPQTETDKRPIIVVRKRAAHHVHHGGAWKVAYADFVTAMMALFIVLWLMNSSDHMRKAIAGYFNDPRGSAARQGTDRNGAGEAVTMKRDDLHNLKEALEQQIASNPSLLKLKQQIQITITPEGLRIELIESRDGTFFETGSATLNQNGRDLLALLARQLGDVPNNVSVEGHTDARAYADEDGYGNWELSADRANAARRLMQRTGLRTGQISQVRGFADRQLRVPGDPLDPSNRRISVIVHYLTQKSVQEDAKNRSADSSDPSSSAAQPAAAAVRSSPPTAPSPASGAKHSDDTAVKSSPYGSVPAVAHVNVPSMAAGLRARMGKVFGRGGI